MGVSGLLLFGPRGGEQHREQALQAQAQLVSRIDQFRDRAGGKVVLDVPSAVPQLLNRGALQGERNVEGREGSAFGAAVQRELELACRDAASCAEVERMAACANG